MLSNLMTTEPAQTTAQPVRTLPITALGRRLRPSAYVLVAAYGAGLYAIAQAAGPARTAMVWMEHAYPPVALVTIGWIVVLAVQAFATPMRPAVQALLGAAGGLLGVVVAGALTMV